LEQLVHQEILVILEIREALVSLASRALKEHLVQKAIRVTKDLLETPAKGVRLVQLALKVRPEHPDHRVNLLHPEYQELLDRLVERARLDLQEHLDHKLQQLEEILDLLEILVKLEQRESLA